MIARFPFFDTERKWGLLNSPFAKFLDKGRGEFSQPTDEPD